MNNHECRPFRISTRRGRARGMYQGRLALIKDQYWLFLGISLVGILIGGAVPIVLLGPMMVGIFLCLLQRQRGEPVEFGTLFKGFEQFVPGLVVAAFKMIPIFIILVPYYIFL